MSKQGADRLNIDAQFHQTCGKTMTKCMEMHPRKTQYLHFALEMALDRARLCRMTDLSENLRIRIAGSAAGFLQHHKQKVRYGQNSVRTL